MKNLFRSFSSRTLAIAMIAAMIPIVILWIFFSFSARPRIQAQQQSASASSLRQVSKLLEAHLSSSIRFLEVIGSSPVIVEGSPQMRKRELVRMSQTIFTELSLLDEKGYLIDSSASHPGAMQEFSPYFKQALKTGKISVSEPYLAEDASTILLTLFIPVNGNSKQTVKAVVELDPDSNILSNVSVEKQGDLVLVDADGNILFSKTGRSLFSKFASSAALKEINGKRSGILRKDNKELCFLSVSVDSYKRGESGRQWTLISLAPESVVNSDMMKMNQRFAWTMVATVLCLIPFCIFLVQKTMAPLIDLADASNAARHGDLTIQVPPSGLRELDPVAKAFNEMISKISDDQDHLESEVNRRTVELSDALSTLSSSNDAIEDGLLIFDRTGGLVDINTAFNQLFCDNGRCNLGPGASLDKLIKRMEVWQGDQDLLDVFGKSLEHDKIIEEEWVHQNDAKRVVHVYSSPILNEKDSNIGRIWVFRNLTEYRRLEEELRQSQKMEAIGTLAGGVAHDFNNLLTAISGNLALSLTDLKEGTETKERITTALGVTERATSLVRQLLSFSRKSTLEMETCDLGKLAKETKTILAHTLHPSIDFGLEIPSDLFKVDADHNQMQQILMNLCVNAGDAIGKEGTITIRLKNVSNIKMTESNETEFVCLEVEDNGEGMPLEVQRKIFEPFYTTKEQGKGTGLGLSTCYGIAKQHGGWMECESEPGQKTVMRVYLPKGRLKEKAVWVEPNSRDVEIDPTKHTVLIADDEPAVRAVAETVLKQAGYHVIGVDNGAEAVQVVRERSGDIDLLMLDYTMPVMGGKEAFQTIMGLYSTIPVMICSGYLCDFKDFETEDGHIPSHFMQKPYPIDDLLRYVATSILYPSGGEQVA